MKLKLSTLKTVSGLLLVFACGSWLDALAATLYSIGDPTDEEQLYLEYINRARADPTAEGVRLANTTDPDVLSAYNFFSVNLTLMQQELSANPPVPPLAMNSQLLAAARAHSQDELTYDYQGHNDHDGTTFATRVAAQGYPASQLGENVDAAPVSVFYGHAGLVVDWGLSVPLHRININSPNYREIGIGVISGITDPSKMNVGPQIVTQDFGTQFNPSPLITGVVYYDLNGNNFYDVGEGIGGVTVTATGTDYYAVTA